MQFDSELQLYDTFASNLRPITLTLGFEGWMFKKKSAPIWPLLLVPKLEIISHLFTPALPHPSGKAIQSCHPKGRIA